MKPFIRGLGIIPARVAIRKFRIDAQGVSQAWMIFCSTQPLRREIALDVPLRRDQVTCTHAAPAAMVLRAAPTSRPRNAGVDPNVTLVSDTPLR